jgi:hypothetical protein
MALPQHKTCLSILRGIIGPEANEKIFSKMIGRSVSWLKKASCGQIPLPENVAFRISHETGVSFDWLLANDVKSPPRTQKNEPFTRATYAELRGSFLTGEAKDDREIVLRALPSLLMELIQSLYFANSQARAFSAIYEIQSLKARLLTEFKGDDILHGVKGFTQAGFGVAICKETERLFENEANFRNAFTALEGRTDVTDEELAKAMARLTDKTPLSERVNLKESPAPKPQKKQPSRKKRPA